MNDIPMKDSRVRTRAAMSAVLLESTLHAVFHEHLPADLFLKRHFQSDHRIGGRDRRLYSELIFSVLRCLGPLRSSFGKRENYTAFYLAGAAAAGRIDDPAAGCFLESAGLDPAVLPSLLTPETPLARLNAFLRLTGSPECTEQELFPLWIFPRLDFIPDAAFFEAHQNRAPLWLRVQRGSTEKVRESLLNDHVETLPHEFAGNALRVLTPRVNLQSTEAYRKGWVEVQDLSSQCIGLVCAPEAGDYWWDACAGGGGKTLQLASMMNGRGTVFASDVRSTKLNELKRRAALAGFSNIRTGGWDGHSLPEGLAGRCAGVLVDAPCTSSGRWRRNPESRWTLKEEKLSEISALQLDILNHASSAVRPGGVLVYATCSMFRDENRAVVEKFLSGHPDFQLESFPHPLSGIPVPGFQQILHSDGDCDASFFARFRKKEV